MWHKSHNKTRQYYSGSVNLLICQFSICRLPEIKLMQNNSIIGFVKNHVVYQMIIFPQVYLYSENLPFLFICLFKIKIVHVQPSTFSIRTHTHTKKEKCKALKACLCSRLTVLWRYITLVLLLLLLLLLLSCKTL